VAYGRLADLIGLSRFLDSPQLRTAYARNNSVDYPELALDPQQHVAE